MASSLMNRGSEGGNTDDRGETTEGGSGEPVNRGYYRKTDDRRQMSDDGESGLQMMDGRGLEDGIGEPEKRGNGEERGTGYQEEVNYKSTIF